jgi:hypothetical protein
MSIVAAKDGQRPWNFCACNDRFSGGPKEGACSY